MAVRSTDPMERFLLLLLPGVVEMLEGAPSFIGAVDVVRDPEDKVEGINLSLLGVSEGSPVVFNFPVAAWDFVVAVEDPTDEVEVEVDETGLDKEVIRALPTSEERCRPMASCPDGVPRQFSTHPQILLRPSSLSMHMSISK